MSQKMKCFLLWLLLLVSQLARADIVLPGQFLIGDNTSNALRPTTLVSTRFSAYIPVNPIHFYISHPVTLSELRLESATGLDAGANFVIWDSLGNSACVAAGMVNGWSGAPSSRFPLSAGSNISVGFAETRFLTAVEGNQFGTISTAHQSQINIENSGISIKVLDLGSGRGGRDYTVKLAAGDYWIETLKMNNDTSIIVDGPVRIFVKNLDMGSASYINSPGSNISGDISKLLMVVYDSAYLANGSTLSGMVYQADSSAKTINLSSASYLMGRVNGKSVVLGNNSRIDSQSFQCTATAVVDHYEVYYPSSSLTCEPAQVRLAACLDNSCSQLYKGNASVSMKPSNGWSSNPVSLGSSGTADITLSSLAAKSVVIGLSSANPSALLRCYRDGVLDSSCSMNFSDAALQFDFSTFYAGSSTNSTIRAIKSSDVGATKVCVPLLTGNQTLQFGSTKVVSDTASNAVPTINAGRDRTLLMKFEQAYRL